MNQKKIEQQSLIFTICMNGLFAVAGLLIFILTNMQSLFLDFFFSLMAMISTISAILISIYSKKKTKKYPDGMWFLEPLYAIFKSSLTLFFILGSLIPSFIIANKYFSTGVGTPLNFGPTIPYAIIMFTLCFSSGMFNKFQNKRIKNISTMLSAEAKINFIDGFQSLGIGLAVGLLYFIDIDGKFGFLHYTGDFFITAILVLLSISEPIKTIISSCKEMKGALVKDEKTINEVKYILNKYVKCKNIEIRKTGMFFDIKIIFEQVEFDKIENINTLKAEIEKDIKSLFENHKINFLKS